ncbi:TetR/AcrR family transcriptional regulator [Rhodovulum sp. DZ06]|uniref:TetR/AcrR family transcriptional regulator n=1 Tax=Rhodovulum sp. DZ06 TaxID=3425126 RepID=UPI003D33AA0E
MPMDLTRPLRCAPICHAPAGPGRPRGFDRDAAAASMAGVFQRRGYEGASLSELIDAAGLAKSSFYCCFQSKRGALLAAVEAYSKGSIARLEAVAGDRTGPEAALAILSAVARAPIAQGGCFAINAAAELAGDDPETAAALSAHFRALERLVAARLSPEDPGAAMPKAAALMALAIGALTLRKAGMGDGAADDAMEAAAALLST